MVTTRFSNYVSNTVNCQTYRVFLAWISNRDMKAYRSNEYLAPIVCALASSSFDRLILIGDSFEDTHYATWIGTLFPDIQVELISPDRPGIGFHQKIYANCQLAVEKALLANHKAQLVFCISSSTPAMSAMWLRLKELEYPKSQLIQVSIKDGLDLVEPLTTTNYQEYIKLTLSQD